MYSLRVIKHSDITNDIVNEIIRVKSFAWDYDYDNQRRWIESNISRNDIHVFLNDGSQNIAYMNLIDIEFRINSLLCRGYGVGNVCAIVKGKGYGRELMRQVNVFLKSHQKTGLLLCKEQLVRFYERVDWRLLDRSKITLGFDNSHIEIMIFNVNDEVADLIYLGKAF